MDILQLIEELEDILDDASSIPFSKKVSVDPDEIFEIVKEIRASLPEEIRQAKWVNDEKDRIIQEANEKAAEITKQAQIQAQQQDQEMQRRFNDMVSEHAVTQAANAQAEEIIARTNDEARQVRESLFAYVDELLANTQINLRSVVDELDRNRQELH